MSLLASLNPQQREAVECTDGPVLLLAGAGSGKTRVVCVRVAHLILDKGVSPDAILAVTFTNKAANEMRERVGKLLESEGWAVGRLPRVSTFHSFCVRLLRQYGAPLKEVRKGFATDFSILDDSDQIKLVNDARREICPDAGIKARSVLSAISLHKNGGRMGELGERGDIDAETLNRLYQAYENALLKANALDFDDLLLESVRLLTDYEGVLEKVHARFKYLLVDEYQDTNRVQYELVLLLAGAHRNVCVVGDEDQSIYSWRGADIGNILGFERDFPEARVLRLEQNYRSTGHILAAASAVVGQNKARKGKRLWTEAPDGERPIVYWLADAHEEARCITREVERLLDEGPTTRVGVLYRTNAQSRLLEEALRRAEIEFVLVGGVTFYQRAEVKDMLAYVRAAAAPGDSVSLSRILNVPARGIGKSTLQRLTDLAAERDCSLWDAVAEAVDRRLLPARTSTSLARFRKLMDGIRQLLERRGYPEVLEQLPDITGYRKMLDTQATAESASRLENLQELSVAADEADERGESLTEFLDHAALVSDAESLEMSARVSLLTLHTAKGLEFPAVVIAGMEEGLLPHQRSLGFIEDNEQALEEERRLCYVGMTRAQRHLILTGASRRRLFVSSPDTLMAPSRFLQEIPDQLMNRVRASRVGGGFRGNVFRQSAPSPATLERAQSDSSQASPVETHDSVAAIAGFFADRGIKADLPAGNGSGKATGQPARSGSVRAAAPPSAPKLGQALKTLRQQGEFPKGTRVRHKKFGVGVVQRREGEGAHAKLLIYFRNYGMKKLVAGYANLQVV